MRVIIQITLLWVFATQAHALHDYPADKYWMSFDSGSSESIDHSMWQQALDDFLVSNTDSGIHLVDYSSLQKQGLKNLNRYLSNMSEIRITEYNRAEQFAFWVNLYNAITVKLIADNYPVKSIRKLGGWFSLGPWDDELITVEDIELSLNDIEHRILRPIWKDYRIHFVVNCASIGCPNLLSVALTSNNTDKILDTAARGFIQHPRGVNLAEDGVITLSKIFKWYRSDFGDSEDEILDLIAKYLEHDDRALLKGKSGRARYAYDWSINRLK